MFDKKSKAIQEIAKTTSNAIETSEKLGKFLSQLTPLYFT